MSKTLVFADKLLSLRGQIDITEQEGQLSYQARGDFSLFRTRWRVFREGHEVAMIRRKLFSLSPTYHISGQLGEMVLTRKFLALNRQYTVAGGSYDGATFTGNLFDLAFQIEHQGRPLAQAREKLISMRDKHRLEVLSDDADDELFTVIVMVVMQMEKRDKD
ncbi:hypothetical protein [Pseudidiomarina insulisalsae]|uniref:LURP-one-related family protein n=1 Tax=Pseudidiomarina insulisalsae TaxID=575789 RepID=A0A432YMK4_9GAMM|nr:hypothetical protein [Pseudidiomarina insulisalsae]RUO62085.1 hypothetical protein CWI71_04335 [Pseudidiomarina insulisalsae]